MPRKDFTDADRLAILELLSQTPKKTRERIAEEIHCRKEKVSAVLQDFKKMSWMSAKAFCGGRERILALREDWFDQMKAEKKLEEDRDRANIMSIRHELGLPLSGYTHKDGTYEV
jgi:hypothetical protein